MKVVVPVLCLCLMLAACAAHAGICWDCQAGLHELNDSPAPFSTSTVPNLSPDNPAHAHTGPTQYHAGPDKAEITATEAQVTKLEVSGNAESGLLGFNWSDVNSKTTVSVVSVTCEVKDKCQCDRAHAWIRYYKTNHYYSCNCNDMTGVFPVSYCTCNATVYMWKKAVDCSGASSLAPCYPIAGCNE